MTPFTITFILHRSGYKTYNSSLYHMSATAPTLPVELYGRVLEYIAPRDLKTLCSLLLTSSTLSREAERIIYRDISKPITPHILPLLRNIASSPKIANLVQSLRLWGIRSLGFGEDESESTLELFRLLSLSSLTLINLKQLSISYVAHRTVESLLGNSTFQLEISHCTSCSDLNGVVLRSFLESQRRLHSLHIPSIPTGLRDFPITALQSLTLLSAPYNVIHALLPGRNVTDLRWSGEDSWVSDTVEHDLTPIVASLRNLSRFTFSMDR